MLQDSAAQVRATVRRSDAGAPPPSRAAVDALIADALAAFDDDVRAAWAQIRIEPTLWTCRASAPREQFWAIAIDDGQVLWLNDFEGPSINRSPFAAPGAFDIYSCDENDLVDILEWRALAIAERRWPSLEVRAVPAELAGPGVITRRQPAYWELRTDAGIAYRAHFRDRRGDRFAPGPYPAVALCAEHPLLALRDARSGTLYFNGKPADAAACVAAMDAAIREVSAGWRTLADYEDLGRDPAALLRVGHGLLLSGPEPVCRAVTAVLEAAGVTVTAHGYTVPTKHRCAALVFGHRYLLAGDFRFERI